MICQVIINDFEIQRRINYILDDTDFKVQESMLPETDDILTYLQKNHNELFSFVGTPRWGDLKLEHFHIMIINMLKILSNTNDTIRGDKTNAAVMRLTFFLCSFVSLLQKQTGSVIDLLRVNRVSDDDVLYDYTATLNIKISPIVKPGLKVVIDNEVT